MKLITIIAFRNLFRHKGRNLVIGTILFIGALVMVMGNGIISGMEQGLETNIAEQWSGHILIVSSEQKNDKPLFNPLPLKIIKRYSAFEQILSKSKEIHSFLPATKGVAMVLNMGGQKKAVESMMLTTLLGVDLQKYKKMFNNNLHITEGRELNNGEKGILINSHWREKAYESENFWLHPQSISSAAAMKMSNTLQQQGSDMTEMGSSLVLMGIGDENSALDVLADVKGIFEFNALNSVFGYLNIIDLESFRECFEYVTHADGQQEISKENLSLLNSPSDSYENFFSDEQSLETEGVEKDLGTDTLKGEVDSVDNVIRTNEEAYNLVFVKLWPNEVIDDVLRTLNSRFQSENIEARAISWKDGVGYISDISLFFRIALNVFVFFIFFVAVIIIINTLSMASMERIPEIGTMRAIGARKSFIGKMFLLETSLLSLIFGGLGIVVGCLLIFVISQLHIQATSEMMNLAFGGDTFKPIMDLQGTGNVMIQLAVVTVLAIVYPIHLATKVSPIDAVARD